MFETQSIGDWLPKRYQKWMPFLGSLVLTPFLLLAGITDFGPEGPHSYVGFVIFPYSAGLWLAAALLNVTLLFYGSLVLMLCQIPLYGLIASLSTNKKVTLAAISVIHVIAVVIFFVCVALVRAVARN